MLKAVTNEIMGDSPIEENEQELAVEADTIPECSLAPIETRLVLPTLGRLSISDMEYISDKLRVYSEEVRAMIEQNRAARIEELRARLAADAAELAALHPAPTKKVAISNPSTPKYRDPAKPENTWAGRGKQPLWLKEKIEAGAKIEDFLIENQTVNVDCSVTVHTEAG